MNSNMPLIDIRADHWEIVRGIFQKRVPECEVWAFNSRATWKAKEFSHLGVDKPLPMVLSNLHAFLPKRLLVKLPTNEIKVILE